MSANASPTQARSEWAFNDSVGFNTHFIYTGSPYDTQFDAIAKLLFAGKVHHIRDGGWRPRPSDVQRFAYLGEHGITHGVQFNVDVTEANVRSALDKYYPYLDMIEPHNEYDGYRSQYPTTWVSNLRSEMSTLDRARDSDPRFKKIVIVGPAMRSVESYSDLGSFEESMDAGNLHAGTCDLNPGNTDGSGHNGLPFQESFARRNAPTKPIWTTEVGFNDNYNVVDCAIPRPVIAKYIPRMFAERFIAPENQGSARTYFYQLVDMPSDKHFGNEGVINADGTPKIQWTALSSLLVALADSSATFKPGRLDFAIAGATPQTHTLLLQHHSGRFDLLVWQETKSWQSNDATRIGGHPIPVPTIDVTLTARGRAPRELLTYQPDWTLRGAKMVPNARHSYTIPVTDSISIVRF